MQVTEAINNNKDSSGHQYHFTSHTAVCFSLSYIESQLVTFKNNEGAKEYDLA